MLMETKQEWVPSFRSQFVTARTYCRPLDEDGKIFERRVDMIDRSINHQRELWEVAKGKNSGVDRVLLTEEEEQELQDLKQLMISGEGSLAGRTMWLGGTEVSRRFHASQFNCSFLEVKTVHDVVDAFHLLLLGCGVGFTPVNGVLNGFTPPVVEVSDDAEIESNYKNDVEIEVVYSTRSDKGYEFNREETYWLDGKLVWRLIVGDSGLAWAKAAGKIMAMKKPVDKIILDFSEIRPGGKPLKGFGWIASGDAQISKAFKAICIIMAKRSDQLLTKIDILDIMNWLGTALSSRRSAEMASMNSDDPESEEFAVAKKNYYLVGNEHRAQSNNSLIFNHKPTKRELRGLFSQMLDSGGSEPGFINGAEAKRRAPWFKGTNPCVVGGSQIDIRIDGNLQRVRIKDLVEIFRQHDHVDVLSFDSDTGDRVWKKLERAFLSKKNAKLLKVTDTESGKSLICTPDHLIFTRTRGWVEAKDLLKEDVLVISK